MAKINYYVRSTVEDQPVSIYLRIGEVWAKTNDTVFIRYWDKHRRWLKTGKNIAYDATFTERKRHDLETRLYSLKLFISENLLGYTGVVDKEFVQSVVNKFYNVSVNKYSLYDYFAKYVADMESGKRMNRTKRYAPRSIDSFRTVLNTLGEFQGIYSEKRKKYHLKSNIPLRPFRSLTFNDVNGAFLDELKTFCLQRNYHPNNTSILIERLKTVLRAAKEDGLHKNEEFLKKAFKTSFIESQDIYLTEEEVERLYKLDLSMNPFLDQIKDMFLCGCYTAQRFSDFSSYRKEMVKEVTGGKDVNGVQTMVTLKVIDFRQLKTNHRCIIPLRPELEKILQKYDYSLPNISYSAMNENIKGICKMAGIDSQVYHEVYENGMRIKKTDPKYKLVCTHTARRSGATNMQKSGMSLNDVAKIGGWRNLKTMQRYLKMSEEETAISISDNPFFRGNPLSVAN